MGPVQTVNFVTALNVPCISPNNLKSREREIGKTIEEYARTSCKKALEEEYLMDRNDRTNEEDTALNKSLDVSFDGDRCCIWDEKIQPIRYAATAYYPRSVNGNRFNKNRECTLQEWYTSTTPKQRRMFERVNHLVTRKCCLGHNVKSFDAKIIIKALTDENLINGFKAKCNGFVDTLHVFRAAERKSERKSFKQEELVNDFLGENFTYDAHNALEDVLALQELTRKAGFSLVRVQPHSFSI
ncbi:unnamed protein product [Mytilus coruscus]|uniref:Mutator-like transposase domain-containing protein n=1 Tax=Mytilus coruscus TaxID=42192 RepID=A0A6J8CTY3_MYTCO|nr:unnamed protein product [Mytilus coruscus]